MVTRSFAQARSPVRDFSTSVTVLRKVRWDLIGVASRAAHVYVRVRAACVCAHASATCVFLLGFGSCASLTCVRLLLLDLVFLCCTFSDALCLGGFVCSVPPRPVTGAPFFLPPPPFATPRRSAGQCARLCHLGLTKVWCLCETSALSFLVLSPPTLPFHLSNCSVVFLSMSICVPSHVELFVCVSLQRAVAVTAMVW